MTEPPEEREFGPSISRRRRLVLGIGMIAALVGLVILAVLSSAPPG